MDVPISLGVTLATAMSLFQTTRGSEQVYFDAAVTLLFFLLIGRYLDQRMRTRAAGAAANLIGLKATTATLIKPDGSNERVSCTQLETRRPYPGRQRASALPRRPCRHRHQRGRGKPDHRRDPCRAQSDPALPSMPAPSTLSGPIVVEASATDQNTLLSEIGRLMESAEQGRGRYVRLADRAARLYAPCVHVLGLATFLGWLAMGSGWEAALTAAIAVLIITCPCALALAVPAVQVAASSRLFSKGVIVKAADGLERLSEVDTVVLDKTGTLTLGEPRLVSIEVGGNTLLAAAARLASVSRHPYARAVVRAAAERHLAVAAADHVTEVPGCGLSRVTGSGEERLGSGAWSV